MLQDLKITNGNLSLKFDPLNTKYTVIMNNNDNELKIEYKLKNNDKIHIEGNSLINNYKEVVIIVFNDVESMKYYLYVYKESTNVTKIEENYFSSIETPVKKEISSYAVPVISSITFLIILFTFTLLFKKKKRKM